MTQETLFIAGLQDIQAVRIDCKCGASASLNPQLHMAVRRTCHQCGEQLITDNGTADIVNEFLARLSEARQIRSENFSIRLVFRKEEDAV